MFLKSLGSKILKKRQGKKMHFFVQFRTTWRVRESRYLCSSEMGFRQGGKCQVAERLGICVQLVVAIDDQVPTAAAMEENGDTFLMTDVSGCRKVHLNYRKLSHQGSS